MIKLHSVEKEYRLGRISVKALQGIDLVIEKGDFTSICGPSGSGKSTLLNLIGCLDSPTAGKLIIMGKDVHSLNDTELSKLRNKFIGFIFQSFNLISVLNAFENVEYPLIILGVPKRERHRAVWSLMEEVGLSSFVKHRPDELSGGQRQRVAIARALVTKPVLVLADEPTANLDSVTGKEILELMKKMNTQLGTTFVFSTHDSNVMGYAQKIFRLKDGKVEL
jgi:putative ABC transport system ATP-binding protein